MLKKLGYISYLLGLEGIIFVVTILFESKGGKIPIEGFLFLSGIIICAILQFIFITYTLKTLNYRRFEKTGAIDEYLSLGVEDNYVEMQLPLIWQIIGWIILIISLGSGLASVFVFSEYVFNTWKSYDIYSLYAFLSIIISIASFIYTLRVLTRKWLGKEKKEEL